MTHTCISGSVHCISALPAPLYFLCICFYITFVHYLSHLPLSQFYPVPCSYTVGLFWSGLWVYSFVPTFLHSSTYSSLYLFLHFTTITPPPCLPVHGFVHFILLPPPGHFHLPPTGLHFTPHHYLLLPTYTVLHFCKTFSATYLFFDSSCITCIPSTATTAILPTTWFISEVHTIPHSSVAVTVPHIYYILRLDSLFGYFYHYTYLPSYHLLWTMQRLPFCIQCRFFVLHTHHYHSVPFLPLFWFRPRIRCCLLLCCAIPTYLYLTYRATTCTCLLYSLLSALPDLHVYHLPPPTTTFASSARLPAHHLPACTFPVHFSSRWIGTGLQFPVLRSVCSHSGFLPCRFIGLFIPHFVWGCYTWVNLTRTAMSFMPVFLLPDGRAYVLHLRYGPRSTGYGWIPGSTGFYRTTPPTWDTHTVPCSLPPLFHLRIIPLCHHTLQTHHAATVDTWLHTQYLNCPIGPFKPPFTWTRIYTTTAISWIRCRMDGFLP